MKYLLVVFIGLIMSWETEAQNGRPPNYSQDRMPVTSFSCRDKILGGYYADPETHCQMFHVCVKVPGQGVQDYKFLCPNDTSFDQENQICDDWYNIDCEASTLYYSDNFDLYRIGSDLGGVIVRDTPRLPNNNINNAVSDVEDNYLQRSDRGDNIGSDLLRGSHTGNFFSNKYRGREEEDLKEELNKKKKANVNKTQVRKLLTGKRPVSPATPSPQVAYQDNYQGVQPPQQARVNFGPRSRGVSNYQRTQQPVVTESSQRQTEVYSTQRPTYNNVQRNFYTPTTAKVDTAETQRNDYYRNNYYNSVSSQGGSSASTVQPPVTTNYPTASPNNIPYQTTRNYAAYNPTSTELPVSYSAQPVAPERINNYETQKLYKINTAAFQQGQDQYEESKDDEFLKTAHSQNLGASNYNRVQNSLKQWNATLAANYNFQQPSTVKVTTAYQQNYNPTTIRPSSPYYQYQSNAYTASTTQKPYVPPRNNFYQSTSVKPATTITQAAPSVYPQQNSYFSPSTTQRPYQQTQNNFYTPSAAQRTTVQQTNTGNYHQSANSYQPANNFRSPTPTANQISSKPRSRGGALYAHTTDATESPRPFTVPTVPKQTDTKEKEQYDYAYYDDGAAAAEYDVDTVDFARTKSKTRS